MPGLDRTGPEGQGSMTGRRMGVCNNNDHSGIMTTRSNAGERGFQKGFARNRKMGYGYRFGNRHGFQNQNIENTIEASDKTIIENEINILKNQLSLLEDKLSKIKGE